MKVSKLVSSLTLVMMLSGSAFAAEGDAGTAGQGTGSDASNAALGGLTNSEIVGGAIAIAVVAAVAANHSSSGGTSGTTGTTGTTGTH